MLSKEQLHDFRTNGYVLVRQFADATEVEALKQETDELHEQMARLAEAEGVSGYNTRLQNGAHISWEERDDVRRIRQLMNSERVCPTINRILHSEKMIGAVRQLTGHDEIIKYHSKLLMKAAMDGSYTPWHQDWGYWRNTSKEPTQINCMLSIDGADLENGCVRFVDGSHTQGAIDHKRFESASFGIGLDGDIESYTATPVETAAGDAVFFGSLVIHGSAPNPSNRNRRANTFAFDRAGNHLDESVEEVLLTDVS